ncbi:hypothetical protein HAX54_040701 [Datura stramonium]|uniref:RecA-like N-terminal domain-containing protein n=1 Tax=Datura stramonium TaxID=4076 RepID=A0ABS8VQL2_DATST|nr:hypothetical protein [Datura stramonium]
MEFESAASSFWLKIGYKSLSYSTSVKLFQKVSRPQFSAHGIRQKALEAAMNDINSSFGKGSVTRSVVLAELLCIETFPSGCLTLDFALGGGLPKGENCWRAWSCNSGRQGAIDNLDEKQKSYGSIYRFADRMCRSGAVDLICIDSVSALTPRAEIEGEIGMQQMGLQARLMSQALRKMSGNASKAGCTLIFLNQKKICTIDLEIAACSF